MTDRYAGAQHGWAHGAILVYGPLARTLVAHTPHDLAGRTVLDAGAGTGAASVALTAVGARPIAIDSSYDMLSWNAPTRPPAAAADVTALPLAHRSVDDSVSAFVLNHLLEPARAIAELIRVTRPGGALLACVYSNDSRSDVRDQVDAVAIECGWEVPEWYMEVKANATPLLGTAPAMEATARSVGLEDVTVVERPVDVGVTEAEQLVAYRFGQAHFASWLSQIGADRAEGVRRDAIEAIRPIMRPYEPIVIFLAGRIPD